MSATHRPVPRSSCCCLDEPLPDQRHTFAQWLAFPLALQLLPNAGHFFGACFVPQWLQSRYFIVFTTMRRAGPLSLTWAAVASCARPNLRGSSTVNVFSLLSSSFEGLGLVFQRRWAPGVHWFRPLRNRTSGPVALHDLQIIIMEISKAPTLRLKALNTHSITP